MSKKVIALVGMPGTGKGTCTDYLHEKYGWKVVHFGHMVYDEVQRRGLDNVKDEVFVREDMRRLDGPAVLAKHATRKVQEYFDAGEDVIVLDGLYSWTEYKHLAHMFGEELTVIAVVAPKTLRRERVLKRKDGHRTYTIEQLITRETAEIENLEKGGPIAFADYTIVNDESLEALQKKIEKILKEVGISN